MQNETVLVVEDEPAIREMIVTTLEMAGFDCLQAGRRSPSSGGRSPCHHFANWMLPGGQSGIDFAVLKKMSC